MLEEKVCVVTGAAQGIGRATAVEMARQGAVAVVLGDIDDAGLAETAGLVEAEGAGAAAVHCDMERPDEIRALVDTAASRFGGLDVLHNNAGVHESDLTPEITLDTLSEEIFDRVYRINLRGPWLAVRYAAPYLRRSTRGPAIVNAGSTGGLTGYPGMNAYGASKGGLIQLTRCLAVELAPHIRVNCYAPASVETRMVTKWLQDAEDPDAVAASMVASQLIPRFGRAEEVARLVCYLASEDAGWITGSVFPIDGGCLASSESTVHRGAPA